MRLKRLGDQVVVVMGASTGIGRLTALELARRGAKVVVSARDSESLAALAAEVQAGGGRALAFPADVSDPSQVQAVVDRAEAEFGGIDSWINVAATSVYATFEETTAAEFGRVIAVNLLGYANGARAALPALRRRGGGALINVSSVEARVALPYHSAYAASKHGVAALTDALRIELRHEGAPISVTNIMPASIDTPFFDHARSKLGVKPRPLPPVYRPEKVAGAILYACTHPVRELVVGGAGRLLIATRLFFPALSDAMLSTFGMRGQRTDEPRGPADAGTLRAPIGGDRRIRGDSATRAGRVRQPPFWTRHPVVTLLGIAAATISIPKLRARFAG